MVDQHALGILVKALDLSSSDIVIEIGPGTGQLTNKIYEKTKHIIGIEIDHRFIDDLQMRFPDIILIKKDILQCDLRVLLTEIKEKYPHFNHDASVHIISNMPYYITTPILFHIIDSSLPFDKMVLTMQQEVAQRMCAPKNNKEYGALTVKVQYYFQVQKIADFSPRCFFPRPQVSSTGLLFTRRETPPVHVDDVKFFFEIVRLGFSQRRKMFKNLLCQSPTMTIDSEYAAHVLASAGLAPTIRAEACSLDDFARISHVLWTYHKKSI